jgi:hypothetical protein
MSNSPRGGIPTTPPSHSSKTEEDHAYAALERADRLRRRRDSWRALFIVFVVIPGVVDGVVWLVSLGAD